jgi:hypothetical protein
VQSASTLHDRRPITHAPVCVLHLSLVAHAVSSVQRELIGGIGEGMIATTHSPLCVWHRAPSGQSLSAEQRACPWEAVQWPETQTA